MNEVTTASEVTLTEEAIAEIARKTRVIFINGSQFEVAISSQCDTNRENGRVSISVHTDLVDVPAEYSSSETRQAKMWVYEAMREFGMDVALADLRTGRTSKYVGPHIKVLNQVEPEDFRLTLQPIGTQHAYAVRDAEITARIEARQARFDAREAEAIAKFKELQATGARVIEAEIETAEGYVYNVRFRANWYSDGTDYYSTTLKNAHSWSYTGSEEINLNCTEYPSTADLQAQAKQADDFATSVMC